MNIKEILKKFYYYLCVWFIDSHLAYIIIIFAILDVITLMCFKIKCYVQDFKTELLRTT